MAKTNVTVASLLSWDSYRGKPIDETLALVYAHAAATSKTCCDWYWTSIRRKKQWSLTTRAASFVLLLVGTCAPLLAAMQPDVQDRLELTQYGVAALAAAGLLQVCDRVFGWSSGWLRYITTVTAMESLTRKFELDWAQYIIARNGVLVDSDARLLFEIAARVEGELVKMQSDETDKWVDEYHSGTALLGETIKTQRESGELLIETARAAVSSQLSASQQRDAAHLRGAVEVALDFKSGVKPVLISIDGVQVGSEFVGTGWSSKDLLPGQHQVTVRTAGAAPQEASRIAVVPPGGVCSITIAIA